MSARLLVALSLCVLTAACGAKDDAGAPRRADSSADASTITPMSPRTAAAPDSSAPRTMDAARNRAMLMDGDEQSELEFIARGGGALEVHERATFGDDGKAIRTYTFDRAGVMTNMTEDRTQTVLSGNASPAVQQTMLSITTENGATNAVKLVDGKPAPVRSFEVDKARRHAEAVRKIAPTTK